MLDDSVLNVSGGDQGFEIQLQPSYVSQDGSVSENDNGSELSSSESSEPARPPFPPNARGISWPKIPELAFPGLPKFMTSPIKREVIEEWVRKIPEAPPRAVEWQHAVSQADEPEWAFLNEVDFATVNTENESAPNGAPLVVRGRWPHVRPRSRSDSALDARSSLNEERARIGFRYLHEMEYNSTSIAQVT